jgi:hypothetical protein
VAASVGMSLVINTTFPFERIVSVYAGPKEIKSTGSSSKSSSKTGCCWGVAFSKRASFNVTSPRPHDRRKTRRKLAQSSIQHSTAFSGPALSNGASLGLQRNRISERPNAIKAHS